MKKIILLFSCLFIMTSCVTKVAITPEYWNQSSRVGIFVNVNPPAKYKEGSQGLLDMAVTSGGKYQDALNVIGNSIKPKTELVTLYSDILKSKGKEVVVLDENFDSKTATKFKGEKQEGKKYATYDFRDLKSKYNIDEVLFVNTNYGFMISYYGMIETGKAAHTIITTNLVDVDDNSLIYSDNSMKNLPIKKWNDNNYENSVTAVRATLDEVIAMEKTKIQ